MLWWLVGLSNSKLMEADGVDRMLLHPVGGNVEKHNTQDGFLHQIVYKLIQLKFILVNVNSEHVSSSGFFDNNLPTRLDLIQLWLVC